MTGLKKAHIILLVTLIIGLLGAWIYGKWLFYGFERQTGFLIENNGYNACVRGFTAGFFLLYSAFCVAFRKTGSPENLTGSLLFPEKVPFVLWIISAFLFILGSLFGLYEAAVAFRLTGLVHVALAAFAAAAVLQLASAARQGAFAEKHAFFSVVPVFWGCYTFMLIFKENAANPVIEGYFYRLLAGLFCMLFLYRFSAVFYARRGVWSMLYFAGLSIYFVLLAYGGEWIAFFTEGRGLSQNYVETFGVFGVAFLASVCIIQVFSSDESLLQFIGKHS